VFISERVTRFKTRVYEDLCGFDPVDRVCFADKIEKAENGLKFEEFRSFARTRVGSDSNNTRRISGKTATPGNGVLRAGSADKIAATTSRDPQERPLIPYDPLGIAPHRGEAVPAGTTQRLRGAEDEIHDDVQADGTSKEGKEGGMLSLPAATGGESTFPRVRGENARPLRAVTALAPTPSAIFSMLANGSVAQTVRAPMSSPRKRFLSYSPVAPWSTSRASSRARVTSSPRGFIASPADPLPPVTHEYALTTIPRRANHRAADEAVNGIFERNCPKAAQPLHYWMGEGWGFVPSAKFCGVRSPGKAKERAQ